MSMRPQELPVQAVLASEPPAAVRPEPARVSWQLVVLSAAVPGMLVGFGIGWFAGRGTLEHRWKTPIAAVTEKQIARSHKDPNAEPVPAVGTPVLKPMPLQRSREGIASFIAKDKVKVTLGTAGRSTSDGTADLHLVLSNESDCEIVKYAGVAYGFDADGKSAAMNAGGEHFVAFAGEDGKAKGERETFPRIAAGATGQHSSLLRHAQLVNMVIAHVDAYTCADGRSWKR